jgi:DNA-binding NtrC family response regulator
MPLGTQARLLRVLETGEFIRVGSSKVQKTDVRVIAATNRELLDSTRSGKFREDLYYRLSTVPIRVPSLRDRKEDINLLFRKFSADFAERYKTTPVQLDEEAKQVLMNHGWQGNVRELKNIAEQISVLSSQQLVTAYELKKYLPDNRGSRLPVLSTSPAGTGAEFSNEREILYKLFFDMKKEVTEIKKMFLEILQNPGMPGQSIQEARERLMGDLSALTEQTLVTPVAVPPTLISTPAVSSQPVLLHDDEIHQHVEVEESLNIMDKEKELILKALKKHKGKRRDASNDLGISERTLYRKLKEYDIEE